MFSRDDMAGNVWFQQQDAEFALNHGVRGAHAAIAFQCERCWMVNLERRLPVAGRDDAYLMFIRRANLDAMSGRAASTISAHATSVIQMVRNSSLIGKTPNIPARGPMPLHDPCGMGVAIDILLKSLTAKSRIRGQEFVQYSTVRKVRSTFSTTWESSPTGISEGSSFERGSGRGATLTSCPTQQKWFSCFAIGAEIRMGHATKANRAIDISIIARLLELAKEEMTGDDEERRREFCKFGAAVVVATTASLRGPEVFKLDLAGIRAFIDLGREGAVPDNPMKKGVDLTHAPHVFYAFLGKFKGELGFEQHLVAVASDTVSGLEPRWWIEQLIRVREEESCVSGPAFGKDASRAGSGREYDVMLHHLLEIIQKESPDLISPADDVRLHYGFYRSFRKTSETRARIAGLDSDTINAMNRWKTIERARGRRPRWSTMIEHYSDARALMPVTWRYSFIQ
jgi:hypothetical protein